MALDSPDRLPDHMKKLTGQHNPFTLMGGGLFHLAFGALLTGSVFGQK